MIKIGLKRELGRVNKVAKEVRQLIEGITEILGESYGEERDIDRDSGGYILIVEDDSDFKHLNKELYLDIETDVIPEFVDLIKCSNGQIFTHTLILCNNDFGISIFMPLEITPENLKQYIID